MCHDYKNMYYDQNNSPTNQHHLSTFIANHEKFEVENILKKHIRGHKYSKVEYLIQCNVYLHHMKNHLGNQLKI